jgi:WXG100 family type VII secretion target
MTATIVVRPERLRRAAAAARTLGGRLLQVRGQLAATLEGVDAAVGDGEARAAFATLRTRWSTSAERLEAAVDDLAAALEAAADGYERADGEGVRAPSTAAVPPRPPAGGAPRGGPAPGGGADATTR